MTASRALPGDATTLSGALGADGGRVSTKLWLSRVLPLAPAQPSIASAYDVPRVTGKLTRLQMLPALSSFWAMVVRPPTAVPVYAPSTVSKRLPCVVTVSVPLAGAVQRYQMEASGLVAPCVGSPGSRVAPVVEPDVLPVPPVSASALAKASLVSVGDAVKLCVRAVEPFAPPQPSIAMA